MIGYKAYPTSEGAVYSRGNESGEEGMQSGV